MKNRAFHFLKILLAAILFCAPCALCFLLLREKLPENTMLYSYSGALWIMTPIAGFSAAVALKGSGREAEEYEADDEFDEDADISEDDKAEDGYEKYIEEYSELYEVRTDNSEPLRTSPDIAAAISAQKQKNTSTEYETVKDVRDSIWEDFAFSADSDIKNDSIYDELPSTLPEGFSFTEEDEYADIEDDEEVEEHAVSAHRFSLTRVVSAAVCAVTVIMGALVSSVYVAETPNGVAVGHVGKDKIYEWSDVDEIVISPDIFGDGLRMRACMNDGKKLTLFSGFMLRGKAATEHYDISDAALCAFICMESKNAEISINDIKTIKSSFADTDDWEYISEIIGIAQ